MLCCCSIAAGTIKMLPLRSLLVFLLPNQHERSSEVHFTAEALSSSKSQIIALCAISSFSRNNVVLSALRRRVQGRGQQTSWARLDLLIEQIEDEVISIHHPFLESRAPRSYNCFEFSSTFWFYGTSGADVCRCVLPASTHCSPPVLFLSHLFSGGGRAAVL